MTPFQSNLNSKIVYNQKHFEEEKNIQSNEAILFNGHLANKSKKFNTEIKILNQDQNLNEKVGGLLQML